jgi:hypothetical protein
MPQGVIYEYQGGHCFHHWRGAGNTQGSSRPRPTTESEKADGTFHFLLFPSSELREDGAEEKPNFETKHS